MNYLYVTYLLKFDVGGPGTGPAIYLKSVFRG
jgi:hypothetical protein